MRYSEIDSYIASFPKETQTRLKEIRAIIRAEAPDAEERFAYRMPGYYLNGPLVYFAGYAKHIGLYALPKATKAFEAELKDYKHAKGSIQFPLDKPLPKALIRKIVRYRVKEKKGF